MNIFMKNTNKSGAYLFTSSFPNNNRATVVFSIVLVKPKR